jgi:hypothetical protein
LDKSVWILKGKSNAGDNMTSYVNANSNVIKSYVEKQENRTEKEARYQMKIVGFQEIIITRGRARTYPVACSGVYQRNFDF